MEVDREGEDASARPPHGLFGLVAWSTEIQLQVQRGRQMGADDAIGAVITFESWITLILEYEKSEFVTFESWTRSIVTRFSRERRASHSCC